MSLRYSIILPYFKRPTIQDALLSFRRHKYGVHRDCEVIIVEAPQNARDQEAHRTMERIVARFPDLGARWIPQNIRETMCPGTAYNLGVRESQGEYIVLSNPECVHHANVLAGFSAAFAEHPDAYLVAACLSLDSAGKPSAWYQHSKHCDKKLNHCTAISRANYDRIGGFDEAFADGYARTDMDFVWKVMQANIPIIELDDLLTLHLDHPRTYDIPHAELCRLRARSMARLKAKWEHVNINCDPAWLERVKRECW